MNMNHIFVQNKEGLLDFIKETDTSITAKLNHECTHVIEFKIKLETPLEIVEIVHKNISAAPNTDEEDQENSSNNVSLGDQGSVVYEIDWETYRND